MLVPKRFEKPSLDGSQNQTMELETELENRVHPLFGFKEPYSNRFWNPNNLLGHSERLLKIFKYLGLKTTVADKVDHQMSQVILALRGMRSIKYYEGK